jgi:estrogen-related receptor beta like 1
MLSDLDCCITSSDSSLQMCALPCRSYFGIFRNVAEELNRMRTKEKYLNNSFTAVCTEFKEVKKQLEELSAKSGKSNEAVTKLTTELAELSDKLEEMKETIESKDSGINDTSPLVRIKSSLQQIKAEIYSFDLRIGVVSHSLLSARVHAVNTKRIGSAQKAKKLRGSNSKMRTKKQTDNGDDDSLLSGDD